MRLRRKPLPPPGRHRPTVQAPPATASFRYRARRSEEDFNTGRQTSREPGRLPPKQVGRFLLQRFGAVILIIALVFSAVNLLTLTSQVKVMPLTAGQDSIFLRDQSVYQAAASQLLGSSAWNKNKVTVNTSKLNQQLAAKFPELTSASTTIPLFSKRPIVYIEPSLPALILTTTNGAYIIDNTGKALLPASKAPSGIRTKLPIILDESGLAVTLNRRVLAANSVDFIQTVIAQLAARQLTASSLVLPAAANELHVRLNGEPYLIKFNIESGTAREQTGTFLATKSKLHSRNITPSQYIDVRVEGRAYYK